MDMQRHPVDEITGRASWPKDINASTILHSLPNAVFFTDLQMRILYFNLEAEKITGFKAYEACGMYCKDVLKTGICETECVVKKALDADQDISNIETTLKTATGKTIPALVSASLIRDTGGRIVGYMYSFRNISSLKKVMQDLETSHIHLEEKNRALSRLLEELTAAEESLRQSENEKRIILDAMHERMSYRDKDRRILWTNRIFQEYACLPSEKIKGRTCFEILHQRNDPCPECPFEMTALVAGKSISIERSTSDGKIWFIRAHPVQDSHGNVSGFVEVSTDITDLKKAEQEVRSLKQQMEFILGATNTGIDIIDSEYNIRYVDPEWAKTYGNYTGRKCFEYFMDRDTVCPGCGIQKSLETKAVTVTEEVLLKENSRPIQVITKPFQNEEGEWLVAEVNVDITERKKIENALRDSEEKLEAMLQSIGDHMSMMDSELNIIWANAVAKKIFGEDIVGKKCYTAYHGRGKPCDPYPCIVLRAFQDGEVHEHDTTVTDKDGKLLHFHCTANVALRDKDRNPLAVIEISRDITEQKKLEHQLLQAQKMEAIGQLAGGIAHDFNNILTAIIGFSNLLQMEISQDDPLQNNILPILNAAKRASNLTNALLAFSRKQIMHPKAVNLNQIIRNIDRLLSRIIGEDIELSANLPDKDFIVMADASQIEQVLMNLATNARDAMPHGGKLTIGTDFVKIDEQYLAAHGYGTPGSYVQISFEDTGQGIDASTKERIFEPFFTTKDVGKGTGLGLAMVYGIVKQHEGYINVYSEPGRGTTFKIYLPLIQAFPEDQKQEYPTRVKGGRETILVAEDDMQVRNFIKQLLEKYGYTVLLSVDGEDALKVFDEHRDEVQLVVVDTVMPKKNGREVYDEIKKARPDMKAIFTSGYFSDFIQRKSEGEEGLLFIPKPIVPNEFLTKIYETLHS
ncbi:MAG: PAS domain S-box protein [Nitrospirota bacterium]